MTDHTPNGPPIPMSEFTLGGRYSSEDMYRDYPDLRPGSRVTSKNGDEVYTDTVESVEVRPTLPCSSCGAIWDHAWGIAGTFVCPDCLRAVSERESPTP